MSEQPTRFSLINYFGEVMGAVAALPGDRQSLEFMGILGDSSDSTLRPMPVEEVIKQLGNSPPGSTVYYSRVKGGTRQGALHQVVVQEEPAALY